MVTGQEVVEHGFSRWGRWLHARRFRGAFGIAILEGLLVAFHVIAWWLAVGVAIITVALYFWMGRSSRSDAVREGSWIAATSQALVVLVPVLVKVVGTLAVIGVAALAVVALVALFSERR